MPGSVVEHNANGVGGRTLVWRLDPATGTRFDLFGTSEVRRPARIALAVVVVVAVLALLLALAWAIFKKVARI